jgi:hypothetical protein
MTVKFPNIKFHVNPLELFWSCCIRTDRHGNVTGEVLQLFVANALKIDLSRALDTERLA